MSDMITVGPEVIKPQLLNDQVTGLHPMPGKDYWTKKIRLNATDPLARFIVDNGIDMAKYEIVEPEEYDCD